MIPASQTHAGTEATRAKACGAEGTSGSVRRAATSTATKPVSASGSYPLNEGCPGRAERKLRFARFWVRRFAGNARGRSPRAPTGWVGERFGAARAAVLKHPRPRQFGLQLVLLRSH